MVWRLKRFDTAYQERRTLKVCVRQVVVWWDSCTTRIHAPERYAIHWSSFFYRFQTLISHKTIRDNDSSKIRAIFNWLSKVIRDCIGFASLCSVIGLENSLPPISQSDAKLKPKVTWSLALFRAPGRLRAFTLSSHWFPLMFFFFWLAVVITLILVLRRSIEKRSKYVYLLTPYLSTRQRW